MQAQLSVTSLALPGTSKEPLVFTSKACESMAALNQSVRRVRDELGCKVLEARLRTAPEHKRPLVLVDAATDRLIDAGRGLMAARQPGQIVYRLLVDDVEVMWLVKEDACLR